MKSIAKRNMTVCGALMAGASVLVVLETRILSEPPRGVWFLAMVLLSLGGFLWANAHAFARVESPARVLLAGTLGVAVWLVAVFLVVTIGVNLKFALGGHV
ncbi:MAG: hypothetical protein Q7T69_13450 [Rhodoferax sp.]|nr:hypothetical protein [Rhodoferax sp.]